MTTAIATAAAPRLDVYARVTNQIVAAIEAGAGAWKMPWHVDASDTATPRNVAGGNRYRGINTLSLWLAAECKGYGSGIWGTYRQWQGLGAQVRAGEKATLVVFWKFDDRAAETEDGEGCDDAPANPGRRRCFARGYHVFNAAQVDGYEPPAAAPRPAVGRIADADAFFGRVGADVRHGGGRAFYSPADDFVQMPHLDAFDDAAAYYSTLAHELTHWTGHGSRLDRQLRNRFGDDAYAAEELVAELGAAYVCATLGLSAAPRDDHAQYLAGWLSILKADTRAIFTAASRAQAAADWLESRAAAG